MAATEGRRVDDARLLDAWERARSLARPWRELALLAGTSGEPADRLARLPIGERDRRILALRELVFGARLDSETTCPACGARLEIELDASTLRVPSRDEADSGARVLAEDWDVSFRLPDSGDLAGCGGAASVLLERCVVEATRDGVAVAPRSLPPAVRELVVSRIAELDPQADVTIDLDCSECAHRWSAAFDPSAYLLSELEGWAERLLEEVDRLARAYGWSEAEILALGPYRRRRYLELAAR
ncbi:MAG TPA: hypothetical protein VKE69_03620 [Planctomycetota bacterium]|nr:hypothetical protein [Planctomycetota bacterium]